MWASFAAVVVVLLIIDLGILHRKPGALSVKQSLRMSGFYLAVGMAFSAFVYKALGMQTANDYLTGYIVEETLSMDNIFVMSLIFGYFPYPARASVSRAVLRHSRCGHPGGIMIFVGAELVEHFSWILYVFGAFLVFTGVKMLFTSDHDPISAQHRAKVVRIIPHDAGNAWAEILRQENGFEGPYTKFATPLFRRAAGRGIR